MAIIAEEHILTSCG